MCVDPKRKAGCHCCHSSCPVDWCCRHRRQLLHHRHHCCCCCCSHWLSNHFRAMHHSAPPAVTYRPWIDDELVAIRAWCVCHNSDTWSCRACPGDVCAGRRTPSVSACRNWLHSPAPASARCNAACSGCIGSNVAGWRRRQSRSSATAT